MAFTKNVLKAEHSETVVFSYEARPFPLVASATAKEFISGTVFQGSDFKINPLAAEQAGIAQLQKDALDERIEESALSQLKEVQEKAYKEAYELGLVEGREQAFEEQRKILAHHIEHLVGLLETFENFKQRLLQDHEAHFMRMIFELASRIALREIKGSADSIIPVLKQVVLDAQTEESVTIRVSPQDLAFIEQVKEKISRDTEHIRRVRFEATEEVTSGGCLLETNYGSIDATVERRIERAWHTISERLPKSDQRTSSSGGSGGESD